MGFSFFPSRCRLFKTFRAQIAGIGGKMPTSVSVKSGFSGQHDVPYHPFSKLRLNHFQQPLLAVMEVVFE